MFVLASCQLLWETAKITSRRLEGVSTMTTIQAPPGLCIMNLNQVRRAGKPKPNSSRGSQPGLAVNRLLCQPAIPC